MWTWKELASGLTLAEQVLPDGKPPETIIAAIQSVIQTDYSGQDAFLAELQDLQAGLKFAGHSDPPFETGLI